MFKLMNKTLEKSLKRDKKIFDLINNIYPKLLIKSFTYPVKILKKNYLEMIKKRYISTLLNFTKNQIIDGLKEINIKYKKELIFKDNLICMIIKK